MLMKTKIIGILFCILLIAAAIPATGAIKGQIKQECNKTILTNIYTSTSQNGIILDQDLDENNRGYTIIRLWGSHYEMGYAQAELLGNYIVQAVNENKAYLGNNYDQKREVISDAVWMPPGIEDEFDGMVDCLAIIHPSENIDSLDLKVLNTIGDWEYGCRSHTCWGRYVEEPIKTLSTRRLDYPFPYSSAYHHVLFACDPDGSHRWVSMGWPGTITVVTGVNEFGTLVSLHDYQSSNADIAAGRMARMVACRYALTFATDPDVSTHLSATYEELQNYEIMTGTFLNYYAPEGYGGVLTCHPQQPGPDFYNLRTPQENWHHGETMITTNTWTDGTYTPVDEDFGADAYYNDENAKTFESHWNLLQVPGIGNWRNSHLFSVAYRGFGDMTVWAEGRLNNLGRRTPRLEWEWSDLFDSEKPTKPNIDGPAKGKAGTEYIYTTSTIDPDGDEIYYYFDWGDDTSSDWLGPYNSGEICECSHSWIDSGNYEIKVKARDIYGTESDWSDPLSISMPKNKNKATNLHSLLLKFLENHPHMFLLLRKLIKL